MNNITTIEDCLELAAGLQLGPKIHLNSSDITIMFSIARQVFKGTALTDRQFSLMKEKLTTYKDQFENIDCDFDYAIEQLRQPLRSIDRSKYIKICKGEDEIPLRNFENNVQWFKVRFPFKKSLIMIIQEISTLEGYFHQKGSHEHFFELTDKNINRVIGKFHDKGFDIDKDLIDRYNEIQEVLANKNDYIPYFDGNDLKNCSDTLKNNLLKDVKEISKNNFVKIVDRHIRHGYIVNTPLPTSILEKIAFRQKPLFHSDPREINLDFVLETIYDLDRFPLLVTLEEDDSLSQIYKIYNYFRDLIPAQAQSVLFRLDGQNDFNDYVKEKNLNNWVDESTKIVYINTKTFPKILLKNKWKPITLFSFTSSISREISAYVNFNADLQIMHENEISPFRKYSRLYV